MRITDYMIEETILFNNIPDMNLKLGFLVTYYAAYNKLTISLDLGKYPNNKFYLLASGLFTPWGAASGLAKIANEYHLNSNYIRKPTDIELGELSDVTYISDDMLNQMSHRDLLEIIIFPESRKTIYETEIRCGSGTAIISSNCSDIAKLCMIIAESCECKKIVLNDKIVKIKGDFEFLADLMFEYYLDTSDYGKRLRSMLNFSDISYLIIHDELNQSNTKSARNL